MKKKFPILILAAMFAALAVTNVWSQGSRVTIRGKLTDGGQPVAGAELTFVSRETGGKYVMKTDNKGDFLNVAINVGNYDITIIKDGQVIYKGGTPITLEAKPINIDLAKERQAAERQLSPEERKKIAEEQAKAETERLTVRTLNQKLAEAQAAEGAGNFDQAIGLLTEATQVDATRHLLWARLGQAHLSAGGKGGANARDHYTQAVEAYKKAIAMNPADGGYHNNLGQAYAKLGQVEAALAEYNTAAQIEPANAAMYYFNLGAVLTNTNKPDEANAAFDKALAIDPNKAEAHYWKGVNLLAKATIGKDGKMTAPPGTAESLNKYLELQPQGTYAQAAKELLANIGAEVETSYKKRKKK